MSFGKSTNRRNLPRAKLAATFVVCVALAAISIAQSSSVFCLVAGVASADARQDVLISTLRDSVSFRARVQAALALGAIRESRVVAALAGALGDEHPAVRAAALSSLGRLEAVNAIPAVRNAVRDRDKGVQRTATRVLSQLESVVASRSGGTGSPTGQPGQYGKVMYTIAVAPVAGKKRGAPPDKLKFAHQALINYLNQQNGIAAVVDDKSAVLAATRRTMQGRPYVIQASLSSLEPYNLDGTRGTRAEVTMVLATYPGRSIRSSLRGSAIATASADIAIEAAIQSALKRLPSVLQAADRREDGQ